MTVAEILNDTGHRPWDVPARRWDYYQEWNNAVFLHWQVEYDELKHFVPKDLEIDLHDGKPWVSLVAFSMQKVRPRFLPAFSPVSDFHEINIRTYVRRKGKTGVYFLSIEGGTRISCSIARALSGLPYRFSKMKRIGMSYCSKNEGNGDSADIQYEIDQALESKTALDRWLTERYALFQDENDSINEFEIHHIEWPIFSVDVKRADVRYARFGKLLSNLPEMAHYSPGVQVLAWGREKYKKGIS